MTLLARVVSLMFCIGVLVLAVRYVPVAWSVSYLDGVAMAGAFGVAFITGIANTISDWEFLD